jgi:phosphomannomutase
VIAGIAAEAAGASAAKVVGFEAKGGFLLGFEARGPTGPLAPLLTRDALLPILAPLAAARAAGQGVAALLAALPARATAADRLPGIDPTRVAALLARLEADPAARAGLLGPGEIGLDLTDGLRLRFAAGHILHLRASGNAPELRCYAEADTAGTATMLVRETLGRVAALLASQ